MMFTEITNGFSLPEPSRAQTADHAKGANIMSNLISIKTENYQTSNLEYYFNGYLKGYADGNIEFSNDRVYELLYRFYDPKNGDCTKLVFIDYGYNNPMVDIYWDEIEAKITEAIINFLTSRLKTTKTSVTTKNALSCLNYKSNKRVHSFTKGITNCLSGADLDFERVIEIVNGAGDVELLFASTEFEMEHGIAAWDHKHQEWVYLECVPNKINELLAKVKM